MTTKWKTEDYAASHPEGGKQCRTTPWAQLRSIIPGMECQGDLFRLGSLHTLYSLVVSSPNWHRYGSHTYPDWIDCVHTVYLDITPNSRLSNWINNVKSQQRLRNASYLNKLPSNCFSIFSTAQNRFYAFDILLPQTVIHSYLHPGLVYKIYLTAATASWNL